MLIFQDPNPNHNFKIKFYDVRYGVQHFGPHWAVGPSIVSPR